MKVHLVDEAKSTLEKLIPLCGKDLKGEKERQFLTHCNQLHAVDCTECLEKYAEMQEEYEHGEPIIQLYSPYSYYCSAAIVLSEKGRQKLIEALQKKEERTIIDAFVEDGEGFAFGIFILPESEIRKMQDPYLHDWNDKTLIDPKEDVDRMRINNRR